MTRAESRGDEIVDLQLGFDLFRAQVITESVRAAGFDVRLREMTPDGLGALTPPIQQQVLMILAQDLDAVRRIVDDSYPTAD